MVHLELICQFSHHSFMQNFIFYRASASSLPFIWSLLSQLFVLSLYTGCAIFPSHTQYIMIEQMYFSKYFQVKKAEGEALAHCKDEILHGVLCDGPELAEGKAPRLNHITFFCKEPTSPVHCPLWSPTLPSEVFLLRPHGKRVSRIKTCGIRAFNTGS